MRGESQLLHAWILVSRPARGRIEVEGNAAWEWVLSSTLTVTLAIPIGVPLEGPQETDERS
jgi:hypothetical protein